MKVLFIANRAEFGGAPKCMLELIEILQDRYGIEIEVVTYGENSITEFCRKRNIKSYAVGHVPFAVGKGSTPIRRIAKTILTPYYFLNSFVKNKLAFRKACNLIDFSDIDIIHTNSNRDCLGAMLNKKYGIKHVWHMREFGKEDYDIRYLKPYYIKFMNKYTTSFIAISDAVKRVWYRKGLEEAKIVRIYDGIHLPNDTICSRAFELQKQRENKVETKFAYLGMVCPGKGQFDAIKALALLDKEISSHIHIDFWGDCSALPEYIKEMEWFAKKNGILDSISFRGFTDNIWDVLPQYDAAMVCSRSEAFGRITPEYMSIGLQVIASNTGANPELIEDGISGYIYDYKNLSQLAEKIKKVHQNSYEERMIIAENAKKRASIFSDEKHAQNIVEFYNKLLNKL